MKKIISLLLIIAAMFLVALAAGPVYGGGDDGLAKADQARQRHTDALLAKPGVVGVALGLNPAGKPSVLVLTAQPGVADIPQTLDAGVPVQVRVTGEIFALCHNGGGDRRGCNNPPPEPPPPTEGCGDTTSRSRTACLGLSTGHPGITAGSIGARVIKGGNVYALSNNHVYAASNAAGIGDNVLQPGKFDGGQDPADAIGTLADFEPIVFSTSANNEIDAAIALSSTANVGNATPSDGYGTPKINTAAAVLNQQV